MPDTVNLHAPARQPGESFDAYKARRRASRRAADIVALRSIELGGQWEKTGEVMSLRNVPGARAPGSREQLRDSQRDNGRLKSRPYGKALAAYFERKRPAKVAK